MASLNVELVSKRLEIMHELVPKAAKIAVLAFPGAGAPIEKTVQAAATAIGRELQILHASTEAELDAAFANVARLGAAGLVIASNQFFNIRHEHIAALALRYSVPTIFQYRTFAEAGGLMSYGGSNTVGWQLVGVYTGRILKGEKPADLPVQQEARIQLVINLKTAKAFGLDVPTSILLRADEVIE